MTFRPEGGWRSGPAARRRSGATGTRTDLFGRRVAVAGRWVMVTAVWITAAGTFIGFRDDRGHVDETITTRCPPELE